MKHNGREEANPGTFVSCNQAYRSASATLQANKIVYLILQGAW